MRAEDERTRTKPSPLSFRPFLPVLPLFLMAVVFGFACSGEERAPQNFPVVSTSDSAGDGGEGEASGVLEAVVDFEDGGPGAKVEGGDLAATAGIERYVGENEMSQSLGPFACQPLSFPTSARTLESEENGDSSAAFERGRASPAIERAEKTQQIQDHGGYGVGLPSAEDLYLGIGGTDEWKEYRWEPNATDQFYFERWLHYSMGKPLAVDPSWKDSADIEFVGSGIGCANFRRPR